MMVGIRSFRFVWALLLLAACSLLQSCLAPEESPLSEVEISDPSLITPIFTVQRTKTQTDGKVTVSFTAELLDSQGRNIQLLYGYATVNGVSMRFNDGVYTLTSKTIPFILDSAYTFTLKLSDAKTYSSSVRTPKTQVLSTTVTTRNDTVALAWTGTSNDMDSLKFRYEVYFPDAEGTGPTKAHYESIVPKNRTQLEVKLPSGGQFFNNYRASFFVQDTVNPVFNGGWGRGVIQYR
jgi:hypothetical protein